MRLEGCRDGISCLQHCAESYLHPTLLFPHHASRDCRVRWEHGSRIKCPGFRTRDRRRGTPLRSRPVDSLDATSVFDGRWSSSPYRFAGPCFRVRGHGRHRASVISYLCRSVELEPRFVCESSRCECWLGYPLLTSSTNSSLRSLLVELGGVTK